MLTKREKEILCSLESDYNIDYITDNLSDEELLEDLDVFKNFKSFNNSKKMVELILKLSDEELKKIYYDFYITPIPANLTIDQIIGLIDKGFTVYTSEFTRIYIFNLASRPKLLIKYKHLLDFNIVIKENLNVTRYHENLIDYCYEELANVSTSIILDSLNFKLNGNDSSYKDNLALGILIDKLNNLSKRQFKNDVIIKYLLNGFTYTEFKDPEYLKNIFGFFDDNYIINNISLFNPMHLYYAGRLTEEIYQAIINDERSFACYSCVLLPAVTDLSLEFLLYNIDKFNPYVLSFQKNAVELYKMRPANVQPGIVYFHNKYLSDDELEFMRNEIKDLPMEKIMRYIKIDDYIPPLALERLMNFKGVNNEQ